MQKMNYIDANTLEIKFPIGHYYKEEFQFCRDKDEDQLFFPGKAMAVCGPAAQGHGNLDSKFVLQGRQFDVVTVRLIIKDGTYTVIGNSPATGATTWGSEEAFAL